MCVCACVCMYVGERESERVMVIKENIINAVLLRQKEDGGIFKKPTEGKG